ncbi:MAG: glycosyltransferase family 2 protein [Sedimentisphaerales bacterium]|nr:glycosyltransferase family 2 protein [Sedimentisphaerales bacterium]
MSAPVTVIIPAYNEQVNLSAAIKSVAGWAEQVIVVDSFSKDATVEIADTLGAEIYRHKYESIAAQRTWAMNLPAVRNRWIFNLDADERLTDELKDELNYRLHNIPDEVGAFAIRRKHIFMGRWMRHGGDYIWLIRLVRKGRCRIIKTPYLNEHTIVNGRVEKLEADFIHLTEKTFTEWVERQARGSLKYTLAMLNNTTDDPRPDPEKGESIEGPVRTWLNHRLFYKTPFFIRPFIRFFVNYFLRGGFLDGWQGYVYHTVNDFLYPFFVYANRREIRQSADAREFAEKSLWR